MGLNGPVFSKRRWLPGFMLLGTFLLFCNAGTAQGCERGCPGEVKKRFNSGEIYDIRDLILEQNPEYARLSFADQTGEEQYPTGYDPWYARGKKFFVFKRHALDEKGFLFLDGHMSWLVHDLSTMEDISLSGLMALPTEPFLQCTVTNST